MSAAARMTARAWWTVAVTGMGGLLAVVLTAIAWTPWQLALGLAGSALLVIGWFALGARRIDDPRGAPALVAVTAVATALMVGGHPALAIVQAVAYPIAWVFARSVRTAVLGNLAVAAGVAIGFVVSLGTSTAALTQTAFTIVLSTGFSLAMGFWISRMGELGERNGRLLAELQGAQEQIAALHREAGAASERERLARDLHDTIAQDLTGLVMLAQRARREGGEPGETLQLIEENARAVLAETRALVASGAALGDDDLVSALHRLGERFARETGVEVSVEAAEGLALARDAEVVVLRCVQEALANARKHARASLIEIEVAADAAAPRVLVSVADDGIGFAPEATPEGFGLRGMAERLALVQGSLAVRSEPGGGTRLVATVPSEAGSSGAVPNGAEPGRAEPGPSGAVCS